MKLATHRAITRAAAYAVGVKGGPLLEAMLSGVEEPDRNHEEELRARISRRGNVYYVKRRVRHHSTDNSERIMRRLWTARRLWLKGRKAEAAWHLGYALHYIQDACVGRWSHEAEEAEMRSRPVPVKAVDAAAQAAKPSPAFLEQVVSRLGPASPHLALENASVASTFVAAAVFACAEAPSSLVEAVDAKKPSHRLLVLLTAASALAGLASIFTAPVASAAAFTAAAIFYAMDGGYRKLRKELKWFRKTSMT